MCTDGKTIEEQEIEREKWLLSLCVYVVMDLMKRDRTFPQHQYGRTQEYPWTHLSESVSLAQIIQTANTLQGESLPLHACNVSESVLKDSVI